MEESQPKDLVAELEQGVGQAPESTDMIATIKRNQRRGLMMAGGGVALLALAGFLLWYTQRSLLPAPDDRALTTLRDNVGSFDKVPKEMRSMAAAELLHEFESDRLPKVLREMLEEAQGGRYGRGGILLLAPLADGKLKEEWTRVCDRGPKVFGGLAELKPLEQGGYIFRKCDLARYRFLSEVDAAKVDVGLLVLAYLIYDHLEVNRALLPEEDALLRHLTTDTAVMIHSSPSYFGSPRSYDEPMRLPRSLPPPPTLE